MLLVIPIPCRGNRRVFLLPSRFAVQHTWVGTWSVAAAVAMSATLTTHAETAIARSVSL